jgi:hypothetical protein
VLVNEIPCICDTVLSAPSTVRLHLSWVSVTGSGSMVFSPLHPAHASTCLIIFESVFIEKSCHLQLPDSDVDIRPWHRHPIIFSYDFLKSDAGLAAFV